MFTKENFTKEHIMSLREKSHGDPILLERVTYAFGLLEALTATGMPFIFKGGTCLLLLLDQPRRLSTDIDIVVSPEVDIQSYIDKASEIFPFKKCEETRRIGKNKIEKRHFKFTYDSPINESEFFILLDVLFEDNKYAKLISKKLETKLLISEEPFLSVSVPSIECLLGDKLTAFAPHTCGILLNEGKDLEVMKQLYDVSTLFDYINDFSDVMNTYDKIVQTEINYRDSSYTREDCLNDTLDASLCIATKGKYLTKDYSTYIKGIRELRSFVFNENFTPENAIVRAAKTAYLALSLIKRNPVEIIKDYTPLLEMPLENEKLKGCSKLKKTYPEAYVYLVKTDQLLNK